MGAYERYRAALWLGSNQETFDVLAIVLEASECRVDCLAGESKDLGCYTWPLSSLVEVCERLVHNENKVESFLCREAAVCFK